jgi:hypothetical protein
MLQSGRAEMDQKFGYTGQGYMTTGTGLRHVVTQVNFEKAFQTIPKVIVGNNFLDAQGINSDSIRYSAEVSNITLTGFDLKFTTWEGTKVHGLVMNWLAYTN